MSMSARDLAPGSSDAAPDGAGAATAPGKVNRTQRMAASAAPRPPVTAPGHLRAAAVQRRQLEHDLASALGFVGGPAATVEQSTARLSAPVQRAGDAHTGLDDRAIASHAARGIEGGGGELPHLAIIQRAFGPHDVRGVRAHVGGAAAEASSAIGAHAYATGNDVAFASSPDLFLAAHEAAHVVQQRGGVQLSAAVGQAGDSYERHADAVADAVVRGDSAAELLGSPTAGPASGLVQRVINMPIDEGGDAAAPAPLPAATRAKLVDDAGNRVDKAFTAFTSACLACSASFKAELTGAEAFVFQLVEVALGYLVPGLGKAANLLLSKSVPIYAADVVQKAALKLIESDGITKALTMATAAGKSHLMNSAPAIATADVKAMLTHLQTQTQVAMQRVGESLSGCSDGQLLAIHAAYDATSTNVETYTVAVQQIIAQYQRVVMNIGDRKSGQQGKAHGEWTYAWTHTTRVDWVRGPGGVLGLGVFDLLTGNEPGTATASDPRGHQRTFREWVPEHFVDAALAQAKATGLTVGVVDQ